jgi:hypothetical protein
MLPIAAVVFFLGAGSGAFAQSVGPDESPGRDAVVGSHAGLVQTPSLTAAQKSTLYQAAREGGGRSAVEIEPTVGATVSPAAELLSLPDQAGIDDSTPLKYAMVEGDLVVIDPVRMRVVDIIRGSMRP